MSEIESVDSLRHISLSEQLASRDAFDWALRFGLLERIINDTDKLMLWRAATILKSEAMRTCIKAGLITIGMIKPRIDDFSVHVGIPEDDQVAMIKTFIRCPLELVFSVNVRMDRASLVKWYQGRPYESQLKKPPHDPHRYGMVLENRWQELEALMDSGPVTIMVMFDPQGDAVAKWRKKVGNSWKPEEVKEKYPDTIRAQFMTQPHNSIVHGSDSLEAVLNEAALTAGLIERNFLSA